jgi:polyhydroxybutyrate depolymerase
LSVRTRILAAVIALIGAAAGGASAALGAAPVAAAAGTTGTRGCGRAAKPGVTTRTITVEGEARSYLLEVPRRYRRNRPARLVFDFHGLGSNMQQEAALSGLNAKGSAGGFVVVTPDGSGTGTRKGWGIPPLRNNAVPFVRQLLARTEARLCIDTDAVFSTGISNGGILSMSLACALPGTFAAVAPVAGVNVTRPCSTGTPKVAVLAFHGTADPVIPFAGGALFQGFGNIGPRPTGGVLAALRARPVDDAVAGWAAFDRCRTPPVVAAVATDVGHTTYPSCADGTSVQLYTVDGGGHTWPGSRFPVPRLGATTQSIDATDLILRFFAAHPRQ